MATTLTCTPADVSVESCGRTFDLPDDWPRDVTVIDGKIMGRHVAVTCPQCGFVGDYDVDPTERVGVPFDPEKQRVAMEAFRREEAHEAL